MRFRMLLVVPVALVASNVVAEFGSATSLIPPRFEATAESIGAGIEDQIDGPGWTVNPRIPESRGAAQGAIVASGDGSRIYSIGGGCCNAPYPDSFNTVWAYSLANGSWSAAASVPLSAGIRSMGAAVELNGFIYVFGGVTGPGMSPTILNTTWIYDEANDVWFQGANMPDVRYGSAVGTDGVVIWVIGGFQSGGLFDTTNTVWMYDPSADTYSTRFASMPQYLGRIKGAMLPDGKLHVLGGHWDMDAHLVYDTSADAWSSAPLIPNPVLDPAVATDGMRIYVAGDNGAVPRPPGHTRIYDPATSTWSDGPRMPPPALNNTSGTIANGTFYVMGGYDGAAPVSVSYSLLVPPSSPVSFFAARTFVARDRPAAVAVGDFNGDGLQDLAVANFDSDSVSVFLANGDGSFQTAQNFAVGPGPSSVAVGDFNGDGVRDLAVTDFFSDDVSVLLGNGDGTFQEARSFGVGSHPKFIAASDFNGDGVLDLAVANYGSNTVSVLLGNGRGSFQSARNIPVGISPVSVAVGDFNSDGWLDLAVANSFSTPGSVSVLLGNGDGSFQDARPVSAGLNPNSVAIGDFNGDGWLDLVVVNVADYGSVSVFLGNGDGTFRAGRTVSSGGGAVLAVVGDFNGDGWLDVAVANSVWNNVSVLLGNGSGSFQYPWDFAAGRNPQSIAVGDFNGDALLDLAVSNDLAAGTVSVLINNTSK